MSRFFVPGASSPEMAEEVVTGIARFAQESMGWKVQKDRIEELNYRHNGEDFTAKVGEREPHTGEPVVAILRSTLSWFVPRVAAYFEANRFWSVSERYGDVSTSIDPPMRRRPDEHSSSVIRTFAGFPAGARATAVPSVFFSELLPQIEDEASCA